ncbi:Prp18 domain-containing protein [Hysterangium stoloniferum]|nr:Prp18 domain-containing protein [Hysterangium stoloniferum]
MDFLKAEIANKRKALENDPLLATRPTKYMRKGDIEKIRLEQERKEKEEKEKEKAAKELLEKEATLKKTQKTNANIRSSNSPLPSSTPGTPKPEGTFNISSEEAIRRLRSKGQPIRLFGESDKDRRLRLRALELIEEKGGGEKGGGTNDFKKALEGVEMSERIERAIKGGKDDAKGKGKEKDDERSNVIDLGLIKTDPDRLYPLIYNALKRTLKEWEESMAERPDHIKRSMQGKLAAATQVQSAEYLKPLFKLLRSRALPSDVLARITEIVHYMQVRQYQRSNDSYLRLSIGNAPWPIGVTMVGIHERSAREKISSDQVAHVLNDEVSRKYIQSLKRLLTFAQTKYPPEDISQLMG